MTEGNNSSILIIDDDITIRKLMSFHLRNNKYKIFEAENPIEAFQILDSEEINLVLCDVTMDEMDGFTFCQKVRENDKHRIIPFIFVTAKSSIEDRSRALEAGGDDFVIKPFDMNELLLKINSLLKRSAIYKTYGVKKELEKSLETSTPLVLLVD
ncbi:MAG: response regulator, partial [Bacteroidota bacterium]|nr:response regulator [Bacteroidota bacterium]